MQKYYKRRKEIESIEYVFCIWKVILLRCNVLKKIYAKSLPRSRNDNKPSEMWRNSDTKKERKLHKSKARDVEKIVCLNHIMMNL